MKKEFELYQDEEGNVYTITTELEQLIIQDLYKAMKRNNEKQDEIERLTKENKDLQAITNIEMSTNEYLEKENKILHSIIKEVREKLLCYGETFDLKVHQEMQKELLEILDKGSDEISK